MTTGLTPSYPPLSISGIKSWSDSFYELINASTSIDLITGYASENSILELVDLFSKGAEKAPKVAQFRLVIGMAFFDGLTERQKAATMQLNDLLVKLGIGCVLIPTQIAVHSKCSIYNLGADKLAIVGSTNLTALLPTRQSEFDVKILDQDSGFGDIEAYIEKVISSSEKLDSAVLNAIPVVKSTNSRLLNTQGVSTYETHTKALKKGGFAFNLPLKTELKSNLNKFNAAPRGRIPRSWYEIEINVPSAIGVLTGFPNNLAATSKFTVYTDDGFRFECHVSGGNPPLLNKNFESDGDLKILGLWLKTRLVSSGCLNEGDILTEKALMDYGRDFLTLSELSEENTWFLDFGRSRP
jgi:hypothetical protein